MGDERDVAELRRKAEERVGKTIDPAAMDNEEMWRALYELQVHRIELEMQNEELHRSQARLEEIRRKYVDLYDFAPIGYLTMDERGVILESNLMAADMLGIPRKELSGQRLYEQVHPDDRDTLFLFLRNAFQKDRSSSLELMLQSGRGKVRYVELRCLPIRDLEGQPVCRTSLQDITDRKERAALEEHLRKQERHALMEHSPDIICRFDQRRRLVYANRTMEGYTGRGVEQTLGLHVRDLPGMDDPEMVRRHEQALEAVVSTGKQQTFEYCRDMEGEPRWFHASAFPEITPEERVNSVLVISRDITHRKHMEDELRESMDRFRQLAESINAVFWLKDRTGMLYVSPAYETVFGRKRGELYQDPGSFMDTVHPDDRERVRAAYAHYLQTWEFHDEYRIVRPDGAVRWISARVFPVRQDGKVVRAAGIAEDITEHKDAQTKLQLQSQILDQVHDAVAGTDLDGTVSYWNKGAERLFGCTAGEVLGSKFPWLEIWASVDCSSLKKILSEQPVIEREALLCNKHGQQFHGHIALSLLKDAKGDPTGFIASCLDISERKLAEEALRRREQEYRELVENSPDLIVRYDRALNRLYANPALGRFYGVPFKELVGGNLRDAPLKGHSKELLSQAIRHVFESAKEHILEIDHPNPSGRRWMQLRLIPEVANGTVESILVVGRDITDLKTTQEKVEQSRDELDRLVKERTAELELQVAERRKAEEAAVNASRAKSEFLANMSHEIRTPLSGIVGLTQLTLETAGSEDVLENLELIRYSAESLTQIVNDILDFSKIEARQMRMVPGVFNLRERLELVSGGFMAQARSKGLEFVLDIEPKIPSAIKADPSRLTQILTNLLSNAVKFTDQGRITLHASQEQREDGPVLVLAVSDTGMGIPSDRQKEIFSSFTQVDSTFTKRYGGTGLGLAISRQLAELMGGSIDIRSEEGRGSTFTLRLPLIPAKPLSEETKGRPGDAQASIPSLDILLAEDNPINQLFMSRFLENAGHHVVIVENGHEALDALEKEPFDLVLMDIQMPEMDGIEATRAIRSADPSRFDPDIPIIALTAYALDEDRERFMAAGMNGFIPKPVDFDELQRVIAEKVKVREKW
jgi:two-component system, sensor histidine kinase